MPAPDPEIDFDLLSDLDPDGRATTEVHGPVTIGHHIYSSVNGYRTVFCSDRLTAVQPQLEAWASAHCKGAVDATRWYAFPLADYRVMTRVFMAGVDRAGRGRVCVHSILLDRATLATDWPGYNPLRFPGDWFLSNSSASKLDDEAALADWLRDSVIPTSVPDSGGSNRGFSPEDGALVQALLYAPRGLVLTGDYGLPAENVVTLFDWLPFAWRMRWIVGSEMQDPQRFPTQVVLASQVPAVDGAPPVLASGMPLRTKGKPDYPTGIQDQWLFRPDNRATRAFRHYHRWISRLPLATAPTVSEENWLLAAFACLRPYEPADECAKDLNHQRTPQLVLGLLCLAWANQMGSAVQRLSLFGQELTRLGRYFTLSHFIEQAWLATFHRPGPSPMTEESRERARARTAEVEANASPHGHVLQAVWSLLGNVRSIGFAAYQSVDLPVADLRDAVTQLDGERRSLFWTNLVMLCNEAVRELAKVGEAGLQQLEHRDAAMRLANLLATFSKYRDRFAPEHQWIFNEMTGPGGTPAIANSLLELLLSRFHYPPEEVRPIRDRLQRFAKLS